MAAEIIIKELLKNRVSKRVDIMDESERDKKELALEKKYRGIWMYVERRYSAGAKLKDPMHDFFKQSIKSIGLSNGKLKPILEQMGDFYSELAQLDIETRIHRRHVTLRESSEPKAVMNEKRKSEKERRKDSSKCYIHGGYEELMASLCYKKAGLEKKIGILAERLFDNDDLNRAWVYHADCRAPNLNLCYISLLSPNKKPFIKLAENLDILRREKIELKPSLRETFGEQIIPEIGLFHYINGKERLERYAKQINMELKRKSTPDYISVEYMKDFIQYGNRNLSMVLA